MSRFLILFTFIIKTDIYASYSGFGPYGVQILFGDTSISENVSIQYTLFKPLNAPEAPHIILAHGFLDDQSSMTGFANHYASWGIKVVTMDLLHSSLISNDPFQDAEDLIGLSNQIGGEGAVIYVGYSAGGMRSIIAAAEDSSVLAVLGLDLVDASYSDDFLALENVSNISVPVWGLLGEPSSCNSYGNGLDVYNNAENGNAVRITEADHCDFESPADVFCTILCSGSNDYFSEDEINSIILNLSTSFLLWQAGLDSSGGSLWTPGNEYYDDLIYSGAISQAMPLMNNQRFDIPRQFKIYQNYPNPFNPITTFKFDIQTFSFIEINIFNVNGILVKKLISQYNAPGENIVQWNSTNNQGEPVSSGVYYYRIMVNNNYQTKKMLLLK